MKLMFQPTMFLVMTLGLIFSFSVDDSQAASVRKATRAGSFYPSDPAELRAVITRLTAKARKTPLAPSPNHHLRAIIMPHAGYIYSGWTAAHASRVLHRGQYSKVILLGPDHYIGINNGAICNAAAYETPLGKISLHEDSTKLRLQSGWFQSLPASLDKEHSLEVILPFLQAYLGKFQLVPIIVGRTNIKKLATKLDSILDNNTLMVISSDLSHFLSYTEALNRDRETIDQILRLNPEQLITSDNRACGRHRSWF